MKDFDFELNYNEMYVDDMKAAKEGWQTWLRVSKTILKKIQNFNETKINRWDLKSLETYYKFFIKQIEKTISIYSELIDLAELCELEEQFFIKKIKELKAVGKELKKEYYCKSFKELNNKYVHGIQEAEITSEI